MPALYVLLRVFKSMHGFNHDHAFLGAMFRNAHEEYFAETCR